VGNEALVAEQLHGFDRKHAMGTAAVGDDFAILWQLIQPAFEFVQGDRERTRQMPGTKLFVWTHVDHQSLAIPHPAQQLFPVDRIEADARFDEILPRLLDFRKMPLGKRTKLPEKYRDRLVGDPVNDRATLPPSDDKPALAQDLQMPGCVCDTGIILD